MSINEMVQIRQTYKGAVACWETFTQNLEAYCTENQSIPDLLHSEDRLSVSIEFTDTKVVCRFAFAEDGFYLIYSFAIMDEYDKVKFIDSSSQFVDDHGDTLAPGGRGNGWSLQDKDSVHYIFFPRVLQAQKDAWEYAKAARESATPVI